MKKLIKNEEKHILSVAVVIICQDKVLLLQRSDSSPKFPGEWSLPGGKFDEEFDRTIMDTAIRETLEETSFNITSHHKFVDGKVFWDSIYGFAIEFVVVNVSDEMFPFVKLSYEHKNYMWCPLELVLNILTDNVPMTRQFFKKFISEYQK